MTFDQDDKPDADHPQPDSTNPAGGSGHASMEKKSDNDAWLEQWLARDQKPAATTDATNASKEGDENSTLNDKDGDSKAKSEPDLREKSKKEPKQTRRKLSRGGKRESLETVDELQGEALHDHGLSDDAKPTSKFAAAVAEFQEKTPVLLEPGDIPQVIDEDEDIIIDAGPEPEPTSLGARLKRILLSDKTTAAFGVVGELLITGGALVLLFLAWQLWINNAIVAGEQAEAVKKFSNELSASPSSSSSWTPKPGATSYGPAPVLNETGPGGIIGNMYVPRLGSGSTRAVANGVNDPSATINRGFYGRYENSQWPGQSGNFAMAVHRTGWGTSFTQSQTIRPGDHFYLETPQGWYIYTVRNTEYVVPTQVTVVNPVPLSDKPAVDGQSIMTITTCSPINGNGERLVIYGILSDWQPIEAGIPAEITKLVQEARG